MIAHDAPIRWAANAPSAALLVEALRESLPPTRMVELPAAPQDGEPVPDRRLWRIWPLDGPPLVFKRYTRSQDYRTEVGNLRFYNVVARANTPRLLACDDAANALLIEAYDGPTVATMETLGSLTALHTWERVLSAIAAIHVRAERQVPLLRRLYAPQWPAIMPVPAADLLEASLDALFAAVGREPLTVSERGLLIAAGSWLHARLSMAAAYHRAPIIGLASAHNVVATAGKVICTELCQPALGLPPFDVLCTWRCVDRPALIEGTYLAERIRLGAPLPKDLFWELDATLLVAVGADRLRRLARPAAVAVEGRDAAVREACAALVGAARRAPELRAIEGLITRRSLH